MVAADGFTLLAGPDGAAWAGACDPAGAIPVRPLLAGRDFGDPGGAWIGACGIGPTEALLARPDQHVAWRARAAPPDPRKALAAALEAAL